MKPTLPTVCRRYKIRVPVFHLPVIRHTCAEHSIRFCLINLLNKDTRSTIIMERVDTDPYPSFKFYMKEQRFDSYQKECIIINSYFISYVLVLFTLIVLFVFLCCEIKFVFREYVYTLYPLHRLYKNDI